MAADDPSQPQVTLGDLAERFQALEVAFDRLRQLEADRHRQLQRSMETLLRRAFVNSEDLEYPYRLVSQRFRVLSQNEEDGMTLALLGAVRPWRRRFVELGCGSNGGNSGFFARDLGWSGLMVDGDADKVAQAALLGANATAITGWITRETVNDLVISHGGGGEIDLLSIDLDGNDYWIWDALEACRPSIAIVEYNSLFGPDRAVVVPYDAEFKRRGIPGMKGAYYGASLAALAALAERKGYRLVATEPRGTNAYFLRNDCAKEIPAAAPSDVYRLLDKHRKLRSQLGVDLVSLAEKRGLPLTDVEV